MKHKFIILLIGYFFNPIVTFAQIKHYEFEQIDNLQKIKQKNTIVFIHTEWCNYCQMMKNTTFKKANIIKLINEEFYFIDLNAEYKKDISFNGKIFRYKPTGTNTGIHELAVDLAKIKNIVTYPTIVFLNSDQETIYKQNEFMNSKKLETTLNALK